MELILSILASPNVVFALFVIAGVAILIEVIVPGLFGPGILGVIALGLAFVGFWNLPGSWLGVALIALAMGLFYGESLAPGFSVFGAGGLVSLIVGALLLFGNFFSPSDVPEPSFLVNPIMIALMTALMTVFWYFFIKFARTEGGVSTGFQREEEVLLEGQWGVAVSELRPAGKVWVANEEWSASTEPGGIIKEGDEIRVGGVYGEVLKVEELYEDIDESISNNTSPNQQD